MSRKTTSEYVIDALRSDQNLRSPDITERVSEMSGREMKLQDIASILAKISNKKKCDLGFLIQKKKTNKGYTYNLVPESSGLSPEQLYDLTRRTGPNRFTLEKAIEAHPEIKNRVTPSRLESGPVHPTSPRGRRPVATKANRIPNVKVGIGESDQTVQLLFAQLLEKISDQDELNININFNVRFAGFGSE